jgi:hypothetical protein
LNEDGKARQRAARSARLSAALRENLKRRKAQARGRADGPAWAQAQENGAKQPGPDQAPAASDAPDFRRNRGHE